MRHRFVAVCVPSECRLSLLRASPVQKRKLPVTETDEAVVNPFKEPSWVVNPPAGLLWLRGLQPPEELRLSARAEAQVKRLKNWAAAKAHELELDMPPELPPHLTPMAAPIAVTPGAPTIFDPATLARVARLRAGVPAVPPNAGA